MPETLLSWSSFEAMCDSYQPNTTQPLQAVPTSRTHAIDQLAQKVNVCLQTGLSFYKLLSNISDELDGPDKLMWRSGASTTSECDAYLELADCGIIASGTMLTRCRAGASFLIKQNRALRDIDAIQANIISSCADGTRQGAGLMRCR